MSHNPEIGKSIDAGGVKTNYHDLGEGRPVILIHGSGPGVTAWANWRLNLPVLSERAISLPLLWAKGEAAPWTVDRRKVPHAERAVEE